MTGKKLYRSTTDRKIAGVCGGLAQYLDVDSTVLRIIFLVMLFCCSLGFWVYMFVWLLAPQDNNYLHR